MAGGRCQPGCRRWPRAIARPWWPATTATLLSMRVAPQECTSRLEALESRALGNAACPVRREAVGKGPPTRDLAGGPPNANAGAAMDEVLRSRRRHMEYVVVADADDGQHGPTPTAPLPPPSQTQQEL